MKVNTKFVWKDGETSKIKVKVKPQPGYLYKYKARVDDSSLYPQYQNRVVCTAYSDGNLMTHITLEGGKKIVLDPVEVQAVLGVLMASVVAEGYEVSYSMKNREVLEDE